LWELVFKTLKGERWRVYQGGGKKTECFKRNEKGISRTVKGNPVRIPEEKEKDLS